MPKAFKTVAVAAAKAINEHKAEDIVVLDVRKTSPLSDYMIIATALSRPHLESLEYKLEEALEKTGLTVHHRNRPQSDVWRVLDYGGLIVHLMDADARELYALERLHEGAKELSWRS
ncbi:MAG: ribosome silencing factor [Elusimicrobiota bacterium]|nr:MAG: ribosome silencing factor [Elusimicrobiota bacterium]